MAFISESKKRHRTMEKDALNCGLRIHHRSRAIQRGLKGCWWPIGPFCDQAPFPAALASPICPAKPSNATTPSSPHAPNLLYPNFLYYDLTQPDFICRQIQILNSSTNLQVVEDPSNPSPPSWSRFRCSKTSDRSDGPPITFRVQIMHDVKPEINLVFSGPRRWIRLRHEHPNEFEQYLRPMFRAVPSGTFHLLDG